MPLQKIFYPESIAIVGASTKVGTVGNDVVKNLTTQGYNGQIYPVNPKTEEIFGLKCYKDLSEIPAQIDLIIVAIPASAIPELIPVAAQKGVKGCIIISAGFKEVGNFALEKQVKEACDAHHIALIGPNCLGIINPEIKMNASFAQILPKIGPVAFFSQSGALCTAVLDYAEKLGIGFSKFVSMGNKAQVDEIALFEYIYQDEKTKILAMYVEDLKEGLKFREAALKLTKGENPKPIIILKSGKTSAGASASASHTGSLAGSDAAYDALFRQSGIIRAESISQLFDLIQVFTNNNLPQGNRVCIITNAGGPGVLTTDAAITAGLELAQLSGQTKAELKAALPLAASSNNPVDILGDAKEDRYQLALEKVAADKNVDSILLLLTPQSMTEIEATAKAVIATRQKSHKPLVACFMGETTVQSGVKLMKDSGIATTFFPEEAAKALGILSQFATFHQTPPEENFHFRDINESIVSSMITQAKSKGQTAFPEAEAIKILAAYGIPTLQSFVAKTKEEALEIAQKIGKKMVLKIVSQDILHKSDAGGVILNVLPEQVSEKYDLILENCRKYKADAVLEGVLLVEMIDLKRGSEFIIGSNLDPALGQTVMVGMGGIFVEVFKDVTFSLTPISKQEAKKMLQRIKSHHILQGVRGQAALDSEKLIEIIGRISQLLSDFPEIKELDINPLLIFPKGEGVIALDARIII